jgi:hypothetical protein
MPRSNQCADRGVRDDSLRIAAPFNVRDQSRRTEGSGAGSALQTGRGQTTIDDVVVTKVAGVTAREVRSVHNLGSGVARRSGR